MDPSKKYKHHSKRHIRRLVILSVLFMFFVGMVIANNGANISGEGPGKATIVEIQSHEISAQHLDANTTKSIKPNDTDDDDDDDGDGDVDDVSYPHPRIIIKCLHNIILQVL